MKAITIYQPWATPIAHGFKHYETHSWQTQVRCRIAIHAGRRVLHDAMALCELEPFGTLLTRAGYANFNSLPLGPVVGTAVLENCVPADSIEIEPIERNLGDFRPRSESAAPAREIPRPRLSPLPLPLRREERKTARSSRSRHSQRASKPRANGKCHDLVDRRPAVFSCKDAIRT